jgi:hypothetical protein
MHTTDKELKQKFRDIETLVGDHWEIERDVQLPSYFCAKVNWEGV